MLFSFLSISIFAQIDDLKDKSEDKKNEKSTDDTDNNYSNIGTPNSYCADACFQTTFHLFFNVLGTALINHHLFIMKSITDPSKLSLEVSPVVAYGLHINSSNYGYYDYFNVLPKIHARWGILSTDFRYNMLFDFHDFTANTFKTWEWNLIQLNIQPANSHLITFGTGINFESYSQSLYNEHLIGYTFKSTDMMYSINATGRLATDYQFNTAYMRDAIFFSELNLSGQYKFLTYNHLFGYAKLGIIYQNYYASHQILMAQGGLSFIIY